MCIFWSTLFSFDACSFSNKSMCNNRGGSQHSRFYASGAYSTRYMYLSLSGATITNFKDMWRMRVTLKIKVFMWQLIRGKLPCSEKIAKRTGPSNGLCALYGDHSYCNHIFFACSTAFLCVQELGNYSL
jgi:hypothetical protein